MHDHIKEGASMKQDSVTDMEYSFRKKKATREEFPESIDEIIPREEWAGVIEPHYPRGKRGRNSRRIFCFLQKILDISAVFL